jgi:hypothetical protein
LRVARSRAASSAMATLGGTKRTLGTPSRNSSQVRTLPAAPLANGLTMISVTAIVEITAVSLPRASAAITTSVKAA